MADQEPKAYAPGLPDIKDEAGSTPMWVPLLGLFLLVAVPLTVMVMSEMSGDEAAEAVADEAPAEIEAPAVVE